MFNNIRQTQLYMISSYWATAAGDSLWRRSTHFSQQWLLVSPFSKIEKPFIGSTSLQIVWIEQMDKVTYETYDTDAVYDDMDGKSTAEEVITQNVDCCL